MLDIWLTFVYIASNSSAISLFSYRRKLNYNALNSKPVDANLTPLDDDNDIRTEIFFYISHQPI